MRVHKARDCQAVLGLVVVNAVPAHDGGAGLVDLLIAAAQDLVDNVGGHVLGHGHHVKRYLGLAAHGIDVRERVGGGNGTIGVGVIGDGREEVDRLHDGHVVGHAVDRRIVRLVKANQEVGVALDLDVLEELGKLARTHLGAAAGALGKLGELDVVATSGCHVVLGHCYPSSLCEKCSSASRTPPPTARALSETLKQCPTLQRGSMSPDFMPLVTGQPSWRRPRSTPSMVA